MKADFRDNIIPRGTKCFFEYHCEESHDSSDAELWYRSRQQVIILECVNPEHYEAGVPLWYRIEENGAPLAYDVLFADGFQGTAMEDELLLSEADYDRGNPLKKPLWTHSQDNTGCSQPIQES